MKLEIIENSGYKVETKTLLINEKDIFFLKDNMLAIVREGAYNTFMLTDESMRKIHEWIDEIQYEQLDK